MPRGEAKPTFSWNLLCATVVQNRVRVRREEPKTASTAGNSPQRVQTFVTTTFQARPNATTFCNRQILSTTKGTQAWHGRYLGWQPQKQQRSKIWARRIPVHNRGALCSATPLQSWARGHQFADWCKVLGCQGVVP